jgi:mannose-6-phosphate isomerase-like protein (cupin superfamily)
MSVEYSRYSLKGKVTFNGPAHVRRENAIYYVTGDQVSGRVGSWFYLSNDKIHQILVDLPVQRGWRISDSFRPVSHADTAYVILEGVLMLSNPLTGEVHRVAAGEAISFPAGTWYFGLSVGDVPLRALEYIGPEPAALPHQSPMLEAPCTVQDQWFGRWPMGRGEAERSHAMRVIREPDVLWRLEGDSGQVPVGILSSTESLTVGKIRLLPGQMTDVHMHGGDEVLYLPSGRLKVRMAAHQGPQWSDLGPGDGFYVPQGTPHQYLNAETSAIEVCFGVSPAYHPPGY